MNDERPTELNDPTTTTPPNDVRPVGASDDKVSGAGEQEGVSGMPGMRTRGNDASVQDIREDLASLKEDVAALLNGYKERGEDQARMRIAEAKRAAGEAAYRGRERASELADRGRRRAEASHDSLGDFVGERPITSLAIAAGAGAVIAALLRGK